MRTTCLTALMPLLAFGWTTLEAYAEPWPSKPIHAIVPFAAGSTTHIIPRVVFDHLSAQLGANHHH